MVDPHLKEEIAAAGTLSCVINNGRQLCCLDKQGGEGLTMSQVLYRVFFCHIAKRRMCECGTEADRGFWETLSCMINNGRQLCWDKQREGLTMSQVPF